jgi:tetratricopeptide (TPR) repeat protein
MATDGSVESTREAPSRRLVGRARELAELRRALADAAGGRGRLVVLAGEPGIGKTSLADAATLIAGERGFTVRWGRCWESGGAPAYWPWLGVLSAITQALDDTALAAALGDGAAVLAEILPELRQRLTPPSVGAPPPPEEARFRVFRAVVALVREAARKEAHGLAIVLDDLHAADRSSLLLLQFLARELRGIRLLVIATYRDIEAQTDAETSELIARIGREGTRLSLARLGSSDAADLVNAHAGGVTDHVSGRILERAQGNPLFLEEMLRLLAEQGPESIEAGVLPHGVRDVIGQRLARVSSRTRALLELAAVGGDEIEVSLVASAAGESDVGVASAFVEATRAGVLVHRGERQRFGHALFREELYRELDPERRRELHGRFEAALRASIPPGSALPHAKLAHHALEGPPERLLAGVEHALAAAARAQELLAYDDAVETLEHTLAAVANKGNRPVLRADVLVALGEACIRRGDDDGGRRHCAEAGAIARELADPERMARAALTYGRVFVFGSVDSVLVGMLEGALEALPAGDSRLRARLLGRLAGALQPSAHLEDAILVAREAIRTARSLGDKQSLLEVLHDSISALIDCTVADEVRACNLEAEALARELGDRERLLRTHGRMFFVHLAYGELAEADQRILDFEALAAELAAPWLGFRAGFFRAVRAIMHGRFADAERLLDEALALGRSFGDATVETLHRRCREGLYRASERHDALLGPGSLARHDYGENWFGSLWQAFHVGVAHARREEPEPVSAAYRLFPDAFPQNVFSYFFMAEMAAIASTEEQAVALLAALESRPDEYVTLGWTYFAWEGPRCRGVALVLGRLGRYEEAAAAFEEALARLEKLDALPYLARTEYEYARMLLARSGPGDAERAAERLGRARAVASSLGMPGLLAQIERRLAPVATPATRATARPSHAPPAAATAATPGTSERPAHSELALLLEGDYFAVTHRARTFRLKDSLGLRYLARLLEAPGRELHVLDLVREREGASDASELLDQGDAGELLDERAREDYKRRLDDLKDTLAEAEAFGDTARAGRVREELEFLTRELGRAVGLGGRLRKAGTAAERARSAVQRRIRHAIERIGAHDPELARFLERSVRTGNYCSFIPVPEPVPPDGTTVP